ncbi:hypothetical protein L3X38_004650 [Prunus dulcis]|uniref:ubiquitinyl hydrolase 1 n=1 Tax=Prunus dulcis TaxID=3755 RepID=A0AAD4ZPE8_PRUDU|nr:hypothetical protein L3X38_004650 [Prunus dulcis]
MQQHSAIRAEEAEKIPFLGDKEPLSSLAAEYQSGSAILLEKIKVLGEQYAAIRRTRGDGNCFFRSFMFSYLEHILESQDQSEVDPDSVLQGNDASISHDELILRSRDQSVSDYVVMFFRFVTSGEIRKRAEFFEPFILGLTNATVEHFASHQWNQWVKKATMCTSLPCQIALGVPIRLCTLTVVHVILVVLA